MALSITPTDCKISSPKAMSRLFSFVFAFRFHKFRPSVFVVVVGAILYRGGVPGTALKQVSGSMCVRSRIRGGRNDNT